MPKFRFDSLCAGSIFVRSWPEAELKRCGDVGLPACGKKGNLPAFVLDIACKAKAWRRAKKSAFTATSFWLPPCGRYTRIECSVPKFETDFSSRAKPIIRADLFALVRRVRSRFRSIVRRCYIRCCIERCNKCRFRRMQKDWCIHLQA